MMLGKDLILYGDTDMANRLDRDAQRLWCVKKEKDPSTVPFHHAPFSVYSWMLGPVATNMHQFDQHTVWIGGNFGRDNKGYPSPSLFMTPLSAQDLARCSTSYASLLPSHLQLPNYLTYSAGHCEEMQDRYLGGLMPLPRAVVP